MASSSRMFVAVDPSATAVDLAVRVIARLARRGIDAAWVDPGSLHLTLSFLGDVGEDSLPAVHRSLDDVARGVEPFSVVIGGLGGFPSIERPRTLWLGVREGGEQLLAVERFLAAAWRPLGLRTDARPYRPHLTIGRVRDGSAAPRSVVEAGRRGAEDEVAGGVVREMVLYRSVPFGRGRSYERVHAAALGSATSG